MSEISLFYKGEDTSEHDFVPADKPVIAEIEYAELIEHVIGYVDGIVVLGTGGDLREWITLITEKLKMYEVADATPDVLWSNTYRLETTGGRIDLVLVFNANAHVDQGRLTKWMLDSDFDSDRLIFLEDYSMVFEYHHCLPEKRTTIH